MSHRYQSSYDSGAQGSGANYYPVNDGYSGRQPYSGGHNDSSAYLTQPAYPPNSSGGGGGAAAAMHKPYGSGSSAAKPWYKKPVVLWSAGILLVVAIAAGVGGGVAASRSNNNKSSNDNNKGIQGNAADAPAAASSDANGNPIYTSTAAAAAPSATGNPSSTCSASNPTYTTTASGMQIRTDHPRLFADKARWDCLPQLIQQDAYLRSWNSIIIANASRYADMDPVAYTPDGGLSGSGVLDVARELQLRTKHWAYAWRMTNDSRWVTRTWQELQVASGNSSSQSFGDGNTRWNPSHFLDVAEFTAAFAFAYDWMYEAWSQEQRDAIRWSITNLGLRYGLNAYTDESVGYAWWRTTNGNWNNVCNGGLTVGALAVATEDTTGIAGQLLANTVANVKENGVMGVSPDGTWSETADYWYFGNQGLSQMISALQTATGSDQGIYDANPAFNLTGMYHIYGTGFVQKFDYGDCGPNKYTATANALFLYGDHYDLPRYPLYQRDREDAADPLSMLWYNPDLTGDWWYNLPLDRHFPYGNNAWAAMRSSWTDGQALYAAIKAGDATGHQTHGNLDAGTFVLEALGQRFAGELCQNDYLAPEYFNSEAQGAMRWTYYRCMTEGQNTLSFNGQNQLVSQTPATTYSSTGDQQTSLSSTPGSDSAAFFWTDLSTTYGSDTASAVRRGIRVYNQRRQVLLQDEIVGASNAGQWRMHTNATISYSDNNRVATLSLGGQTMTASILASAPNLSFQTLPANRTADAPQLRDGGYDLPNPGVSVLAIDIPSGSTTLEVLFNPQWDGLSSSDYKTPSSVPLSSWSLTSHN